MHAACTHLTMQFNLSLCCNSTSLCLMKCSLDIAPISTRECRSLICWMYVDRNWAVLPGVRTISALDCWDLEGGEWDGLVSFLPWGLKKMFPLEQSPYCYGALHLWFLTIHDTEYYCYVFPCFDFSLSTSSSYLDNFFFLWGLAVSSSDSGPETCALVAKH